MGDEEDAPAPPWVIALYFAVVVAAICLNAWLLPRILPAVMAIHFST